MITFSKFIDDVYEAKRMILSYNDTPISISVHPDVYSMLYEELSNIGRMSKSTRQLNEIGGLPLSTIEGAYNGRCIVFEVTGKSHFVLGVEE